ncbi:hypothetical protein HMPREF1008_00633 [Olsenella sp. oral taxon 809 str. F0356]|uniref:transglutaminase domain-containing protein n=1 Tax=Olsenella sp. oral taxon 809 TaxID=661086 RepID=UPI000231F035|nr:transglutaminase domain-containing protein [Olsenella sp. oral taxon 809]EHF02228.1 hypothetical protein HMPREF1008_00633 [Olsenella sp. oral taxon 809 str. F0356]
MLGKELQDYARDCFEGRLALLDDVTRARATATVDASADEDEACLLRYLFGTLPLSDVLDVEPGVLVSYVRHSLMLRRGLGWTRELPEPLFVHFVLCPRVNNEPLTDCRPPLWSELHERVTGLNEREAVLEINYWCAQMATYQASDGRTLGPLAMLASGDGRCGEESTFLVSALRSVGIPARQIYTPWWAHCDDNHAWVEAYADGGWHYLGACEPEEALDRGWFTNAAGRALMMGTTVYSDYALDQLGGEDAGRNGCTHLIGVTPSYTRTVRLAVHVADEGGNPVEGATVCLEILNSAQWAPATCLVTDASGEAGVSVGLGGLRVRVTSGGRMAWRTIDTAELHELDFILGERGAGDEPVGAGQAGADPTPGREAGSWQWTSPVGSAEVLTWHDVDVRAPEDHPAPSCRPTPEQLERGRGRKASVDELRRRRVASFLDEGAQLADGLVARANREDHARIERFMRLALGNAGEVARFLSGTSADDVAAAAQGPLEADRLGLLSTLSDKDFRDLRADVLEEQLHGARAVCGRTLGLLAAQGIEPDEAQRVYERYVLCPRVGLEHLTAWRGPLRGWLQSELDAGELEAMHGDPRAIWDWLERNVGFDERQDLAKLAGGPVGALRGRHASPVTRATLFVALCRCLGHPARVNPESLAPELFEGGRFVPAQEPPRPKSRRVRLRATAGGTKSCFVDWTLGRLQAYTERGGQGSLGFPSLELWGTSADEGGLTLELPLGTWRLVSTTRLPNGSQQASEAIFRLVEGEGELELPLRTRVPEASDMLQDIPLPELALHAADGSPACASDALRRSGAGKAGIVAFLGEAEEPTEHLLNELREQADQVREAGLGLLLVCRSPKAYDDPTLMRALDALGSALVLFDDFDELPERLARRMYANPEKLPLMLLVQPCDKAGEGEAAGATDGDVVFRGLYAVGGYNVGSVALALRLAQLA